MKLFLTLILLFCGHLIFAQNFNNKSEQKLKQDSTNIRFYNFEKNISDSNPAENQIRGIENKTSSLNTKKDKEQSVSTQNIDIVEEINAVLNYRINRIWRQDLYCLVCENFDPGLTA